ncbi:MAG: ABC transporter permease [Candidatus Limnocylindrales bacterium]
MTESWRRPTRLLLVALGVLTILFLIGPSLIVIPMGFSSSQILEFPPPGWSLEWYEKALTDPSWTSGFVNSIEVAIVTAIVSTILGTLAAMGLVRGRFPGKDLVNAVILSPLIVPVIIIAIGMFSIYVRWKITGTLTGLVIAHSALAIPFVVVSVSTSLRTIDRNLELAAQNLGADPVRTFTRITLPLILPGVLAGFLFAFLTSWDEVVVAIFLTTAKFRTLPVEMWEQVRQVVDPTVAAVATIVLAVTTTVLLLAFVVRRQAPAT